MWVTAEQFVYLVEQVRQRYRSGPYRLDDPAVLLQFLARDYGVSGGYPAPSFEQIKREYLPADWTQRDPEDPSRYLWEGRAEIEPASPFVVQQMLHRQRTQQQFSPGPEMSFARQIIADLELLRSSSAGALTYVSLRGAGVESRDAMNWARLGANVFDALVVTPRGMLATSRAISGNNGQPRDVDIQSGQQASSMTRQVVRTPAGAEPVPFRQPAVRARRQSTFPVRTAREIRRDLLNLARRPANARTNR